MDACPLTTDWTDPNVLIDIDSDARKLEENAASAVPCRPLVVEARRLQWSVASKSQVDVDVVFGLVVRDTGRRLLGVRTLDNSWGWDATTSRTIRARSGVCSRLASQFLRSCES